MHARLALSSLLASVSMYTRLPAWRLMTLDKESYEKAILWLPLVGLITGGAMAGAFYLCHHLLNLPLTSAIICALATRLYLTSAFHEDGLGDFFDGFGGGRDKEAILRIMKDSHIGSYAVIGYIIYYALSISLLSSLPATLIPPILLICDVTGKCLGTLQTGLLPYARQEEQSKIQLVYRPKGIFITHSIYLISIVCLPQICKQPWAILLLLPIATSLAFMLYIYRKIGGYTGDTCGAGILLAELALLIACSLSTHNQG